MASDNERHFAFVGVTTRSSAVVKVFRAWCDILGVNWTLAHWDLAINSPSSEYDKIVSNFRSNDVAGGLVTTHKTNLFSYEWRNLDLVEPLSIILNEVGVIFKRDGELCGGVSDVRSGGIILESLTASQAWLEGNRHVYILGAGGAGLAALWNLGGMGIGEAKRITIVEPNIERRGLAERLSSSSSFQCPTTVVAGKDGQADSYINSLERGPLIINATGLGKDRPGSPVSSNFIFPQSAVVWDFNYRGELEFLGQAEKQAKERNLSVHDGFQYFACGWSVVMSRVAGRSWNPHVFSQFLKEASAQR